jgi:AraC-like DNA-binding protein
MNVSFLQPRQELRPHIKSLWVCESALGLPATDRSLAAPNGCPKLIVPYENSLESIANGRLQVSREKGLYFVGNRDSSTLIRSSLRKTGFIGIEFSPQGAFPVLGIPMQETVNGLFDAYDVFGKWGRDLREALRNLEDVGRKVQFIQDQLVGLLFKNQVDSRLIDFCVRILDLADGRMPIKELERRTGFTRRYLDQLFSRHVGLSPKTLAGIFRFQKFYWKWAQGLPYEALKEDLHDYYYDQAHFTKEFKKMTGYSPGKFTREVTNEFGRRLTFK